MLQSLLCEGDCLRELLPLSATPGQVLCVLFQLANLVSGQNRSYLVRTDSRCLAIVASDFLPHDDVLLRFKELCLRLVKLLIGCCPYTLKLLLPLGSVGKMSYHHFNCGLWFYLSEAPGMIHPLGISDRSMAGGLILVSCLQSVVCLQHFQLRHNGSPHHQPS